MSMNLPSVDQYSEYDRGYLSEMIDREVYGIILTAFRFRKEFGGLTQTDLAIRSGKNKTQISEILRAPANRELRTVAALANAMDMDVYIAFVDRAEPKRFITATGVQLMERNSYLARSSGGLTQWGLQGISFQQPIHKRTEAVTFRSEELSSPVRPVTMHNIGVSSYNYATQPVSKLGASNI